MKDIEKQLSECAAFFHSHLKDLQNWQQEYSSWINSSNESLQVAENVDPMILDTISFAEKRNEYLLEEISIVRKYLDYCLDQLEAHVCYRIDLDKDKSLQTAIDFMLISSGNEHLLPTIHGEIDK